MRRMGRQNRRRGGYSLAEVLTVLAIMGILAAVAIPSVISYRRALKLTELDDSARTIYLAAQNHLSALRSASGGTLETGGTSGRGAADVPGEAVSGVTAALKYVSTDVSGADPGWLVLPGSVDGDLTKAGSHYLVEFDPASGAVYGVFYTVDGDGKALNEGAYRDLYSFTSGGKSCRVREGRDAFATSSGGFLVGYYGADGDLDLSRPEGQSLPTPKVKIINNEELAVEFSATEDDSAKAAKIRYAVAITGPDASGSEQARTLVDEGVFNSGAVNTLVLDTLKSGYSKTPNAPAYGGWTAGSSFAGWVGSGSIVPGGDVAVSVTTWYDPDPGEGIAALPKTVTVTANSLFGQRRDVEAEDGTQATRVEIGYGRHLQNLGAAGLDSAITQAVQVRDIDFEKTTPAAGDEREYWAETYGDKAFTPIENAGLKSFSGEGRIIENLSAVAGSGKNAGLFGSFTGSELKDVVLIDAKATGKAAGSLAGVVMNAKVDNCRTYLLPEPNGKYSAAVRVNGTSYAGGLIGQCVNSTITGSFASTVVNGDQVGGLVGQGGNLNVDRSYAAGSLSGNTVGGLVGTGAARIENCYAAGTIFKASSVAAGLIANPNTVHDSYAAVDYMDVTGAQVFGAAPAGSGCTNVFYLPKYGVNDAVEVDGVTLVACSDEMVKTKTLEGGTSEPGALAPLTTFKNGPLAKAYPYNHVTRTEEEGGPLAAPYPYPTLGDLPHYGDWLVTAAPPTPQSLIVYYEQFQIGGVGDFITECSYTVGGVEQGTLDLTRTGAINAEGYAFLSKVKLQNEWETTAPITVTVTGVETRTTTVNATYMGPLGEDLSTAANGTEPAYYAYAIPHSAIEVAPNGGYYVDVTVQATSNVNGQEPEEVETAAWFNPLFSRSAYNGTKPGSDPDVIHIRSLRQLENITHFYGAYNFVQDLDIDGQIYVGDRAANWNGPAIYGAGVDQNAAGHVTVAGFEVWGRGRWSPGWSYATDRYNMPEEYRLIVSPISSHGSPGDSTSGGYSAVTPFNGTYDGNGRVIRALSIRGQHYDEGKGDYAGLFYRSMSGTLRNITLEDSDVVGIADYDSSATGAVIGRLSSRAQLLNCTVRGCDVTVGGTKKGGQAGGLVGYADGGTVVIRDCTVDNCTVDGGTYNYNAGGLVGYLYNGKASADGLIRSCTVRDVSVTNQYVNAGASSVNKRGTAGGFVGCMSDNVGVVENCVVIGTGGFNVSGSSYRAGGFVGLMEDKDGGGIQNCAVRLEVTPGTNYEFQSVKGGQAAGGFVGELTGGAITGSYASVKVDGANAGGFAGTLSGGSVSNCYAGGRTKNAKYTSALPNVTGTSQTGGFIGLWKGGSLDTCYTTCAVSGPNDGATDVFANLETATMNSPVNGCYALGEAFVGGGKRGSLTETKVATTRPALDAADRTETHAYDIALTEAYPYTPVKDTAGNSVPHYGDWPGDKAPRQGFEWTPYPEEFAEVDRPYLNAAADWNGNSLNLTFVTTGSGSTLSNQFAPSGGHFAITTDLGYVMVFKVVESDGKAIIYGEGGEKFCEIVPKLEGEGDNLHRTYELSIPTASLPPYMESVNMGGFKEGYVLENIQNSDPSASDYAPTEPFLPGDSVSIDGDFSDWDGYPHQLLTYTAGNALTDGTAVGSAFGDGNMIYVHVVNNYGPCLVPMPFSGQLSAVPSTNLNQTNIIVEGDDQWSSRTFDWWHFTGLNYTGPGMYEWKEEKWNTTTWQLEGYSTKVQCYLEIHDDGSQEMEMLISLDELAGSKEVADKIDGFTINFSSIGGSLTIRRELE